MEQETEDTRWLQALLPVKLPARLVEPGAVGAVRHKFPVLRADIEDDEERDG